jgi:hypothetical protein
MCAMLSRVVSRGPNERNGYGQHGRAHEFDASDARSSNPTRFYSRRSRANTRDFSVVPRADCLFGGRPKPEKAAAMSGDERALVVFLSELPGTFFRRAPYLPSKSKRSATDIRSRLAILSRVSNEGAFLPRSIRLRKSTDTSRASANRSWVIRRCARISRNRRPNFSLSVATWNVFPSESLP